MKKKNHRFLGRPIANNLFFVNTRVLPSIDIHRRWHFISNAVCLHLQKSWNISAEPNGLMASERRFGGLMTPSWPWTGVLNRLMAPRWPWIGFFDGLTTAKRPWLGVLDGRMVPSRPWIGVLVALAAPNWKSWESPWPSLAATWRPWTSRKQWKARLAAHCKTIDFSMVFFDFSSW